MKVIADAQGRATTTTSTPPRSPYPTTAWPLPPRPVPSGPPSREAGSRTRESTLAPRSRVPSHSRMRIGSAAPTTTTPAKERRSRPSPSARSPKPTSSAPSARAEPSRSSSPTTIRRSTTGPGSTCRSSVTRDPTENSSHYRVDLNVANDHFHAENVRDPGGLQDHPRREAHRSRHPGARHALDAWS